ncbi:MAG: magnesium transporter [Dehalococcoidia bacterium]
MEEGREDLFAEIRGLVEAGTLGDASARLATAHPADQAEFVAELERDQRAGLVAVMPRDAVARIIEYLPEERRGAIIDEIEPPDLAPLLDEVDDDIVADILHELAEERAGAVMQLMRRAPEIAPLLRHPDETAGGHMTRAFIALNGNWTAERAIAYLRRARPDAESAYYLYVADASRRLEGVVSLRDLIIAPPDAKLSEIMATDIVKARDDMDQEEMARLVQRYDLVALPVVDAEDRLVGVITVDDVLDVLEEEATEDILKLAGVGVREHVLSPIGESARRRLPWLAVNMGVALIAAFIVSRFEDTIARVAALAVFMPIIAGQGGNAGIQTSTIVVRGLALDEIDLSDLFRVLAKEMGLGIVKGTLFGGALALIAFAWKDNMTLALVAAAAMFLNMIVASMAGVLIPITLRYGLKLDPATAAGVFDTMLTDIMGFLIFLGLASLLVDRIS